MNRIIATIALIPIAAVSACAGAGAEDGEDGLTGSIKIAGSSTVNLVAVAVAEEFRRG